MKVRIIAGKNKSRKLLTLEGMDTRPMMDRMKEAVFNAIGPYFDGEVILDLFGGSGALSLEALSRGAGSAYIVEKSVAAMKIIKTNVLSLQEDEKTKPLNMDYKMALNKFKNEQLSFDLIFLDPPYKLNVLEEIIDFLVEYNMIHDNGIIVCQYVKGRFIPSEKNGLLIKKKYNYGTSELCIFINHK